MFLWIKSRRLELANDGMYDPYFGITWIHPGFQMVGNSKWTPVFLTSVGKRMNNTPESNNSLRNSTIMMNQLGLHPQHCTQDICYVKFEWILLGSNAWSSVPMRWWRDPRQTSDRIMRGIAFIWQTGCCTIERQLWMITSEVQDRNCPKLSTLRLMKHSGT